MKIYFITSKLNFTTSGGSPIEFDIMMRELQKLGNEVIAVTPFSNANDIPEPLQYKLIEKNIGPRGLIGIQWGIFKIMREYSSDADFFYVDGQLGLYAAGLYRMLGGKPVSAYFIREMVCWGEGEANPHTESEKSLFIKLKEKMRFYIERYIGVPIANHIDLMGFTNPHLKKSYEDFGLKPDKKISMIFCDPFDYKKNMKESGITEDSYIKRNKTIGKLNLFYSSRMVHGKGFDILVKAFAKVKNKDKFNLILGGTGPEENYIRQLIKELGIEKYVEMPGWVPRNQIFESFKKADIFIIPRWRTDLTMMALMDALTFGLPSIVPKGGGMEWVAGKSTLCFKDKDIDDLAEKIEILGNNYKLRKELSRNCYKRLADDEMNYEKGIKLWYDKMREIKNKN